MRKEANMQASAAFCKMLNNYGLATATIEYWRPDHPWLLQEYTWQFNDLYPEFPRLHGFLEHWHEHNKIAPIHNVFVSHTRFIARREWRAIKAEFRLN